MQSNTNFAPEQLPQPQVVKPAHGIKFREENAIPTSQVFQPGRFGRIFPVPQRPAVPDAALKELAAAMVDSSGAPSGDNTAVPAGYTYFGQFVDHDITFDTTPMPEQIVDPQMIHNFRTPKLDLDCLYGLGPAAQPYLFQAANRAKFALGKVRPTDDQNGKPVVAGDGTFDLPRNAEGFALIGDPRNDENLIVAQLHLAMLKFHNAVADFVEPDPAKQLRAFDTIRQKVTWHYQWIVLHDFLRRIADPVVVADVLTMQGRKHFHFKDEPFIPVEFSVAAYRFGHSMIRNSYDHNRVFGPPGTPRLADGTLELLFVFTGPSRPAPGGPSVPLPSNWVIDWSRFFDIGGKPAVNSSRRLDTRLATALHDLMKQGKVDSPPPSLAERNLVRGERVALPTGQAVASAFRVQPLSPDEIANSGPDGAVAKKHGLHLQTPLWYYILKEAEIRAAGNHLGEVGSRIVAEVFLGLLEGDPLSFRSQQPLWKPELPSATPGHFTFADLLKFIESKSPIINPIG